MTKPSEKYVYWFDEIGKESLPIAGGKGANLGEMAKAGFPVPPGFCVGVNAYFKAIEGFEDFIQETVDGITDMEDSQALDAASEAIKKRILEGWVPGKVEKQIEEAYERLCEGQTSDLVAIRSSATAEDLPEASFAGQQSTFLNIRGAEAVVQAVKECWASLFEPRAIYYRAKNDFGDTRVGLCAVVQLMVQSAVSGVMFTADPVSGRRDRVVIEAGWGLGEAIVSGLISPDMYVVDKAKGALIDKTVTEQQIAIQREASGETSQVLVPKDRQKAQKLDDEHIVRLAEIGKAIERRYGGAPQDIEWAVDAHGATFIVQTRAITTLDKGGEASTGEQTAESGTTVVLVKGLPASPGFVSGPARIIKERRDLSKVQPGDILVAPMTSPDYVPVMKRAGGIVTDAGGMTCHAAIVARELGIPCIVGTREATGTLANGQPVTIDARHGLVYEGVIAPQKTAAPSGAAPAMSSGGDDIVTGTKVYINIADADVAERMARQTAADGIGLVRAEFMISALGTHPNLLAKQGNAALFVESLASNLRRIAGAFHPRPVIYRANDFKSNEYRGLPGGAEFEPAEENPMIGFRGCLRYVKDPTVFQMELEALKLVRGTYQLQNIHLMIPFVRTVAEWQACLALCSAAGLDPALQIGMMCEVPSNVILAEEFCRAGARFMSIGSNDLAQLTLGADRDSALVACDFDERDPAVMASIRKVIRKCHRHGVRVSICGQLPSTHPDSVETLVEAGIDGISVNPDALLATKRLVASAEQRILLRKLREL